MKTTLLLILTWFITNPFARATDLQQLEERAVAAASFDPKGKTIDTNQMVKASLFIGYYLGFFEGLEMSANTRKDPTPDAPARFAPAGWMNDPATGAASLLAFIRAHKPESIDPKTIPASKMMTAWYLWNCPSEGDGAKFGSVFFLAQIFGPDYPGIEEMMKSVAHATSGKIAKERLEAVEFEERLKHKRQRVQSDEGSKR